MIVKGNDHDQEIAEIIVTDVATVMIVRFVIEIEVATKDLDLEKGLKNVQEVVQEIVVFVDHPGADLVIESVIAEIIAGTSIVPANPTIPAMEFCLP